jgi:hypothetical protein
MFKIGEKVMEGRWLVTIEKIGQSGREGYSIAVTDGELIWWVRPDQIRPLTKLERALK